MPLNLLQNELAARWRISPRTLERWRCTGEGPDFVRLGGRVIYRLIDVEAFEQSQLQRAVKIREAVVRSELFGTPANRRPSARHRPFCRTAAVSPGIVMADARPSGARVSMPRHTDVELYAWIAQAQAGSRLEYHRGFLGIDVTPVISILPEPKRRQLADLAHAALSAFEKGLVHLVQERVDIDQFTYIAVARPKPKAAAVSLSALLLAEREAA